MALVVKCPQCQAKLRPPGDRTTTRVFQCPRCNKVLTLPTSGQTARDAAPDPQAAAPETSDAVETYFPTASETDSEVPVLAGVDPETSLPPLLDDEPEESKARPIQPHVVAPELGARAFDLIDDLPEPPPKKRRSIRLGRVQIHLVRLAVASATAAIVVLGCFAVYYLVTVVVLK